MNVICEYCKREQSYPCRNTRDMESAAEHGDRECFYRLAQLGGGEYGLMTVIFHCENRAKRLASKDQAGE